MFGLDPARYGRWLRPIWRRAAALRGSRYFPQRPILREDEAARLRAAQIASVVKHSPVLAAANALNATVLVAALSLREFSPTPYLWIGVLCLYIARLSARSRARRRRRAAPTAANPAIIRKAIANAAALGVIWGAAPILFLDTSRPDQLIVTCVCVGMLCGGAFALATLPAAVLGFTIPLAVGCLIALLRTAHDPIHYLAVPLLLCYSAALSRAAIAHGRQFADRVVAQTQAEAAARHDALTGLPNRAAFEAALDKAFNRLALYGERFALLYFDLDDFKRVNDRLGHQAGDQLLRQIAGRLGGAIGERDTVARLGGDEFVLLALGVGDSLGAARRADAMAQCFDTPFNLEGTPVDCRPSIGIALAPADGADPAALLGHADAALYRAKRAPNKAAPYRRVGEDRAAHDRRELAHDLLGAVGRGEFLLHYQPLLELDGGRVLACEALLRWRHAHRGMLAPTQFIPIAERSGAIHEIGEWAMREACVEATTWPERVSLAVNVSAEQLGDGSIARVVESALRESGLAPQRLRLEIAESTLIAQLHGARSALTKLSERGLSIVLDDFGAGHSSFDHIRRLPVRGLKIDRSFVADLPFDRKSAAIVQAVTLLAGALDIEVAAEGIETPAQLEFLRLARCHSGQGFLFARPQSADALRSTMYALHTMARHVA
jgi:diguanylate cyclase (GGDEF)-like protein